MTDISCNRETYPLSVVIATLGGDTLAGTIEQLNRGTIVPAEILICIPEEESSRAERLSFGNVKIVKTACRGQVAQRAVGFQRASHELVLQLDDDLLVDKHCVEHLVNALTVHGGKTAVAPSLVLASSGLSCYRETRNRTLLGIYYWLMNGTRGYRPGSITKAGTNIGIDPAVLEREIVEVEWVAGGCVMHHRNNLILDDFYPFDGKAYCEDLYHSHHLRRKGLMLLVCTAARCSNDDAPPSSRMSVPAFLGYVRAELKARRHFVRLSARSIPRMYLHYVIIILLYMNARLRQLFRRGTRV